jgi:hypothetical protein
MHIESRVDPGAKYPQAKHTGGAAKDQVLDLSIVGNNVISKGSTD